MIKFTEISETKLKFAAYPNINLIGYIFFLVIFIPLLIWYLWFSPINSTLMCHKTGLNSVDCQLNESSLLNNYLTQTNIKNLKKANKPLFRKSNVIALEANPDFPYFQIIGFQKTYYYPSNSLALVCFKYILPQNWLKQYKQIDEINDFIKKKLDQKDLVLKQSLNRIELLIFGCLIIIISFQGVISIIIGLLFTIPIQTIYEFDSINKMLRVTQNKMIGKNIIKEYDFDRINKIRLDKDNSKNIINGYIILQFNPDYDYTIDDFIDSEYGEQNFKTIKEFIERHIAIAEVAV